MRRPCSVCGRMNPPTEYIQIIKRRDYAVGCDEEGYRYFAKNTKSCQQCRDKNRKLVKACLLRKKNNPNID